MHRARLAHAIQYRANRPARRVGTGTTGTCDVEAVKHSIQQFGLSTVSRGIEGFLQSVRREIARIDHEGIKQLDAARSDVPDVERHLATDAARQCQRKVLDVRGDVIGVVEKARPAGCGLTVFDRYGLQRLLIMRNWKASNAAA